MAKIKVELKGIKEIEKALDHIADKERKIKTEVIATALDIQEQTKDNLKTLETIDTGSLRNSITVGIKKSGFEAEIGPEMPYGPYVEFGTRPHFPPPDALEDWARHHGFESAWPICKIIAKRGLPARPYLLPAYFSFEEEFYDRLKELLAK